MEQRNGIKIPGWAFGGSVAFVIAFLSFWGIWNQARADVENLKSEMASFRPLAVQVAKLSESVDSIKNSQSRVERGFEEMQRDIKTLIRNQA